VELNASLASISVLHNTEQAFVWPFPDGNCLTNHLVPAHGSRWRHYSIAISPPWLDIRVHLSKIWTSSLGTAALCSHSDDIGAANHEDSAVLNQFSILDEENTTMDINDSSLTAVPTVLFNCIVVPNF
jgi:hypothetical protein